MPLLHTLLRCLLIVTFCLEGSLSMWASSAMAVDDAHQVAVAGLPSEAVVAEGGCAEVASSDEGSPMHRDCDCGKVSGCTCACVFPAVAIVHTLPFAAQHLLATQPVLRSRAPLALAATTRVFRPPIG